MSFATPTRHLAIAGAFNVRDIGGYPTTDGRVTRWRTLFRADTLHRLTEAEQQVLLGLDIRTIVDLRRPQEIERWPNRLASAAQVHYLQVPLIPEAPEGRPQMPTLPEIYRSIIDGAHDQLRAIITALAGPGALPGLVHCMAGKDRTGVVIALLLGVAGVPTATIASDYALSTRYLAGEFMARTRRRALADGVDWDAYQQLLVAPAEFMLDLIAHLDDRYGGAVRYLQAIGIPARHLAALRDALTE